MAKSKTWTATDISKTGQITMEEIKPGVIRFVQAYRFLDENGITMEILKGGQTLIDIEWIELPQGIRASILDIRDYLYSIALTKYSMKEEK